MRDEGRIAGVRGGSRLIDLIPDHGRRSFLRGAMAHGVAAPVALAAFGSARAAVPGEGDPANSVSANMGAITPGKHRAGIIVRDFADPYLELLRLLREGAEIEHGLMLQYLYCAFSVKDRYRQLVGFGAPTATNLLGVAIQEMQHLGAVNRLLVALGSCPHLNRQDFPYEPDIYPFPFGLEPLSRASAAKYAFCEGSAAVFAEGRERAPEDEKFRRQVLSDIGGLDRPNHVGSLYQNVLDLLAEASGRPGFPLTPAEVEKWQADLAEIMHEGEHDHFELFRSVHEGRHPAFADSGVANVWDIPPEHEAYPAHPLPRNPTAFVGHPNQIASDDAQAIAWLSNLHYWLSLCLLDYGYRHADKDASNLSVTQMMTGLWPLAAELPRHGAGIPFDTLSMGYAPGAGKEQSRMVIVALAREAQGFARTIEGLLPARYAHNTAEGVIDLMGA
ncbi:hypothetical protein GRI89_01570 [Altererythrobacter salegens]|uniref:Iminophenyl-pyruvate dimer synthase domain-containing protein n=1 Tax=Croceibacterium salegens TaxID=1737568 RepID=A0A6I4SQW1_9SPHN|nr:ferritin-like domain-containing protein [Croceibacterium salegens]MXO58233.1 hypothetical protein [Croceibacterium salegens]